MSSKVFLLLGLLAAILLFFTSEVAARDLAETIPTDKKDNDGMNDAKDPVGRYGRYPGGGRGGCYLGGGYGGYPGRGHGGYPGSGYGWGRCY
ncbi:hypothetical protein CRG98_015389 [Punica granatum]|uniref:Glycine-rich protein-like n=1 Tax=Punica granatum TaxID=22663 RepID=A0A2I0K6P3_PUNGR|nr:hypothetical protein CRG98_015389 [Punica granatum]